MSRYQELSKMRDDRAQLSRAQQSKLNPILPCDAPFRGDNARSMPPVEM
jgi:hypothetical protein